MKDFQPAFGLANAHLQTIYSSLFRKPIPIEFTVEEFTLSDGDFVECYWNYVQNAHENTPIVVLFHGLAGSYESPYIQGVSKSLHEEGFHSVIMHFRGCTGKDNRLPRSYHSGETGDALEFLNSLKQRYPRTKLYTVGYSLGANMLLKLLGELKENSFIEKAVAISPPMQLDVCAKRMQKGFSQYYQHRLIKDLNSALQRKYDAHNMEKLIGIKRHEVQNMKTFWEFDDVYTAPIHGFSSAADYYEKSSSKQFLQYIQTPTLIIHSKDDPFMTQEVIPNRGEVSNKIELELTEKGGHVGFIGGSILRPEYYLEKRIVEFFQS